VQITFFVHSLNEEDNGRGQQKKNSKETREEKEGGC
jgi:hypothetical protein